mmetsp:Transcript_55901/g.136979  ORF Transcript_55901/g.136979 Transcript_55901/m.136979 type:complete len:315 (+) Transcript_55901:147-1091(+)
MRHRSLLLFLLLLRVCSPIPPAHASDDEACSSMEEGACQKEAKGNEDVKALPAASSDTTNLKVGETMSLGDRMGPLVINTDGTTSRIANWAEMTDAERANTLRLITKRNAQRLKKIAEDRDALVKEAEEGGVIPDVVETVAPVMYASFSVGFRGVDPRRPFYYVGMGTEMTPALVRDPPVVWWPSGVGAEEKLHTIVMLDPDAPSRQDPRMRHWLHWLVVDVRGKCNSTMCEFDPAENTGVAEAATYKGATPPKGTGLHRYVVLIYEQSRALGGEAGLASGVLDSSRGGFSLSDLCGKYDLGHPKGIRFFVAQS